MANVPETNEEGHEKQEKTSKIALAMLLAYASAANPTRVLLKSNTVVMKDHMNVS